VGTVPVNDELPKVVYTSSATVPHDVPTLEERYARKARAAYDAATTVTYEKHRSLDGMDVWLARMEAAARIAAALILADREN
jgi:hypothetical protein